MGHMFRSPKRSVTTRVGGPRIRCREGELRTAPGALLGIDRGRAHAGTDRHLAVRQRGLPAWQGGRSSGGGSADGDRDLPDADGRCGGEGAEPRRGPGAGGRAPVARPRPPNRRSRSGRPDSRRHLRGRALRQRRQPGGGGGPAQCGRLRQRGPDGRWAAGGQPARLGHHCRAVRERGQVAHRQRGRRSRRGAETLASTVPPPSKTLQPDQTADVTAGGKEYRGHTVALNPTDRRICCCWVRRSPAGYSVSAAARSR